MHTFFSTRVKHIFLMFCFWTSCIVAFIVKVYTIYPFLIEHFYSRDVFLIISQYQRKLFGPYSFNFGDFFFILLFLGFVYLMVKLSILVWYRKYQMVLNIRSLYFIASIFFINYILFTILWGMNFRREPVTHTLKLDTVVSYTPKHIAYLAKILVEDINACEPIAQLQKDKLKHFKDLSQLAYNDINAVTFNVVETFPNINYQYPSIKKSTIIYFMNKMGIAGYHNPFTGEAIINEGIPNFLKPAAMVHEMMHQMGFARESEAAFISFLFAKKNYKDLVSYSIFLDLFLSINQTLAKIDKDAAKLFIKELSPLSQRYIQEFNVYLLKNKSSVQIISDDTYNFFININSKSEISKQRELLLLLLGYQSKIDKAQYQLLSK